VRTRRIPSHILLALACCACGEIIVEQDDGEGGAGSVSGSGSEGACDGSTCQPDEVCGYEPGSGCDAKRVCAKKDRYPNCSPSWYACSCDPVSTAVQVDCPQGLLSVPSYEEGSCVAL
jgi:hypothetical protein